MTTPKHGIPNQFGSGGTKVFTGFLRSLLRRILGNWGDEVATAADLDDIDADHREDGQSRVAVDTALRWTFRGSSTSAASAYVRVPSDNPTTGRWHRSDSALATSVAALAAQGGPYTCLSGDAVGKVVYISGNDTIAQADADGSSTYPAVGIITSKPTSTSAYVQFTGVVTGLSGLTAGTLYYLSTTAGALTATAPSANAQPVGVGVNTTSLLLLPSLWNSSSSPDAKFRRRTYLLRKAVDGSAGAALAESSVFTPADNETITAAYFVPDDVLTADASNNATLKIWKRASNGGSQTAVASKTTNAGGTGNWTAFSPVTLGTISNASVAAGASVTAEITKAGSGVQTPAGVFGIHTTKD